ncbi:cell division protein FtsQ/DivIB [Streptococcus gordonii]|uniref:cell division protein FtsQ/DivIB n=1 Tax=Streptococcus gordonii TaxID=1302 RepID=UPI001CC0DCF2|nr:FtsQ-type POTRA domain-containing protein [Streptococcus gordonii]MBZ2133487.1 FtsQ-type POTRA domain-containing protein [Streptococcus gordonii]MBZ2142024.1 FtsQ-type POTRA domain-containing protein [Streptococcus gordonii]MBZ2144688.1 FtsQ-type POTRA domain-containing protein [Streptococcus gordonii]MBZ2146941.1 FtsQ-type POTRA domain-containing protein [Streptococcus gordonii]
MTTKDKGDQKELQKYLSAWQKRHQEYLEKKSQEKASETDEEERNDETFETSESAETSEKDSSEEEKEVQDQDSDDDEVTESEEGEEGEEGEEPSEDDEESDKENTEESSDDSEDRTENYIGQADIGIEKEAKPDKPRIERIHLYRALPVLVISSLLILLSLYFITPLGSLKNIVVTGNERVSQDEIIKATQIDSRDYTLTTFLNRNQYANNLKKANSWIEKAEISYQFPITFKIQVTEYKILAYEASTGNIYPVISNGTVINQPVKKEALPENYMRLNLSDKAKVKKLVQELSDVPDSIKNEIQTVDLTPSKATKDLLTLTMRDEHKIIVPLSDIHKKLPYYSRVHPLLTEPSIVDMEAGIFSYSASLVQKEEQDQEQEKEESSEETVPSETEAAPSDITDETNN